MVVATEVKIPDQKVIFKERFEIDYSQPLPNLNVNNSIAYSVKDILSPTRPLFALITNNNTPPRCSLLPKLSSIENSSVLKLVDFGVVDYVVKKTENMALIYEQPSTTISLLDIDKDNLKKIYKDREKLEGIILSILSAVEVLKESNISHRSIRADNIFFNDKEFNSVVLGDCAACFPGFLQPVVYETIEAGACDRASKGDGESANDFYAIALCLLSLFAQKNILEDIDEKQIIKSKIEGGSFQLLTKGVDFPKHISVLLKGLLDDDAEERWGFSQAYNYLKDKNYSVIKQTSQKVKRSLVIDDQKYYLPKEIAYVLSQDIEKASSLINSGKIAEWLKVNFKEKDLYKDFNKLLDQEMPIAVLVAKTCILIAPEMPVFYKGLSFFPKGISKAIFFDLKKSENIALYKEVISSGLINYWFLKQDTSRSPSNIAEFDLYINNKEFGYGIERVMYDLDDDIPCNSDLLEGFFVNTVGGVLRCLDKNVKTKKKLYDNSIISFLRCKLGKKADVFLKELNSLKKENKLLGILKLYVFLQMKYGPKRLFDICDAFSVLATPLIKVYKNISIQKSVEESLVQASRSGFLQNMYNVLDNQEELKNDRQKYDQAVSKSVILKTEKKNILLQLSENEDVNYTVGIKISIIIALMASVISFVLSLLERVL
ncbi:MAG: hypothetical protein R3Y43_04465 [Alphaproteobacteria bacterium]